MPKKNEGKKGSERKIRGVFWGASPSDVENSEKWAQDRSIDRRYLYYIGSIKGRRCHLSYYFGNENADKLTRIGYYFRVMNSTDDAATIKETEELSDWLEKVLIENYGNKADNYPNPTWVIHDGETSIELKQRNGDYGGGEYSVQITMRENSDDTDEHKIDHYKQALKEI